MPARASAAAGSNSKHGGSCATSVWTRAAWRAARLSPIWAPPLLPST